MKTETREWIEGIKQYIELSKSLGECGGIITCGMHNAINSEIHIYEGIEILAEEMGKSFLTIEYQEAGCGKVHLIFEKIRFFQLAYNLPKSSRISLKKFRSIRK